MLRKLVAMMLILSIFTVQAQASSNAGLKIAFDELNYSLSVEWDQKDKNFHAAQMDQFAKSIGQLQSKGLTNAQLIDFALSQVKDAKVAKDLQTTFNMIQINKMTPAEARQYVLDSLKNSYLAGASWNGDVVIALTFVVVLTAMLVVIGTALVRGNNHSGSGAGTGVDSQPVCQNSGSEICTQDCIDVYDSENNYTGTMCTTGCVPSCLSY